MKLRALAGAAAVFGAGVFAGGGCARSEPAEAPEPVQTAVRVAMTFTRIGAGPSVAFEGQAHFVRYAETESDRVPAILGIPDESSLPLGTCRAVDSEEELDRAVDPTGPAGVRSLYAGGTGTEVRLLDAGKLRVKGPVDSVQLSPRHYPEVTPYVSGVVYGHEELRPLSLETGASYEVSGVGGEEVGAFVATVQAPRAFPLLELPVYHRGEDLDVRWSSVGEAGDEVLLRTAWSSRLGTHEVRCRVHDDGAFTVRRELLSALPPPEMTGIVEVSATRVRRAPLSVPGASQGMLLVGLRTVLPLAVSAWVQGSAASPGAASVAVPVAAPAVAPNGVPVTGGER